MSLPPVCGLGHFNQIGECFKSIHQDASGIILNFDSSLPKIINSLYCKRLLAFCSNNLEVAIMVLRIIVHQDFNEDATDTELSDLASLNSLPITRVRVAAEFVRSIRPSSCSSETAFIDRAIEEILESPEFRERLSAVKDVIRGRLRQRVPGQYIVAMGDLGVSLSDLRDVHNETVRSFTVIQQTTTPETTIIAQALHPVDPVAVPADAVPAGYNPAVEVLLQNDTVLQRMQVNGALPQYSRLRTAGLETAGPYSATMALPRIPVVHPYNPADEANDRIDNGVAQFSFSARLAGGTLGNLPLGIREMLVQENVNMANVQCCISMQNKPWGADVPLLYRPQPWLHQDAPHLGPQGGYNVATNIRVSIAKSGTRFAGLRQVAVSSHGEVGEGVVFSPNNMRIQGLSDHNTTDTFYSICIEPASLANHGVARAVITLHALLSDADQQTVGNLAQHANSVRNFHEELSFAAAIGTEVGVDLVELNNFIRGRGGVGNIAALVDSDIVLQEAIPQPSPSATSLSGTAPLQPQPRPTVWQPPQTVITQPHQETMPVVSSTEQDSIARGRETAEQRRQEEARQEAIRIRHTAAARREREAIAEAARLEEERLRQQAVEAARIREADRQREVAAAAERQQAEAQRVRQAVASRINLSSFGL